MASSAPLVCALSGDVASGDVALAAPAESAVVDAEDHALLDVLPHVLLYCDVADAVALGAVAKAVRRVVNAEYAPRRYMPRKSTHARVLGIVGHTLHGVSVYGSLSSVLSGLRACPQLRVLYMEEPGAKEGDRIETEGEDLAAGFLSLRRLQTLWLQDRKGVVARSPWVQTMSALHAMSALRKLTLLVTLTPDAVSALTAYLEGAASRRLTKFKTTPSVLGGSAGDAGGRGTGGTGGRGTEGTGGRGTEGTKRMFDALAAHPSLHTLSLVRPNDCGPALQTAHCEYLSHVLAANTHLRKLHIRACALVVSDLAALVPPRAVHLRKLKLHGNWLCSALMGQSTPQAFGAAMRAMLARTPELETLQLIKEGSLGPVHAQALADALACHMPPRLACLTMNFNGMGDEGVAALAAVLPPHMTQLHFISVGIHRDGMRALAAALPRLRALWSLGLNDTATEDAAAAALAPALSGHPALRDIGMTLGGMTNASCDALGAALATCPALRFVFAYLDAMHAVSSDAIARLRAAVPHALVVTDHQLSRHMPTP